MAKKRGVYLLPRRDLHTGGIYYQGKAWTLHLAGVPDKALGRDRFFFSSGKAVLGEEVGEDFKKKYIQILKYMASINDMAQVTGEICPAFVLYGPQSDAELYKKIKDEVVTKIVGSGIVGHDAVDKINSLFS